MRKYILTFLIVVCVLFINISGINAAYINDGDSTCKYGIICEYRFCTNENGAIGDCPLNFGTAVVRVAYRCDGGDKDVNSCVKYTAQTGGCKALSDGEGSSGKVSFSVPNIGQTMVNTGSWSCGDCLGPAEYENGELAYGPNSKNCPYDSYDDCVNSQKGWAAGTIGNYFENKGSYVCPPLKVTGDGTSFSGNLEFSGTANAHGKRIGCIASGKKVNNLEKEACKITDSLILESTEQQFDDVKDATSGGGDTGDLSIIEAIFNWGKSSDSTVYDGISGNPCALINGEVRELLHQVFLGISIGGIIILIVMTAISLIKVITASEDNALSNFIKGLWKRIICLIILLLLPTIITFLIQVVNGVGVAWNINSGNPLCDITE